MRWLSAMILTWGLAAALATDLAGRPADFRTGSDGAFVTVNGARLWYWTEGTGEPLVLVEGGPGASGYLDPFFRELTDRFTVVHLRGLGRGKSDRPASPTAYSFERDVADLEGFRRATGLESFNLLGHSYGGLVVVAYALHHPDAVKRLVIANGLVSGAAWQAGNENVLASVREQYPEVWSRLTALRARGLRSNAPECIAAWRPVSDRCSTSRMRKTSGRPPAK